MKKTYTMIAALLAVAMIVLLTGCGAGAEKSPAGTENGLTGTWAYTDSENEFGAVYVLREDGTGTYTMTVGEQTETISWSPSSTTRSSPRTTCSTAPSASRAPIP